VAFVHGSDATLSIDATDVSAYTDNVSFTKNQATVDVSAFGDNDEAYIAGLRGATLNCSGPWDATADAVFEGCFDQASVAFSYSPDGGTTTYSGNCFITDYNPSAGVADRVAWSASFQITGTVSRA